MSAHQELTTRAEQLSRTASSWADLSNARFDPIVGLVSRAFPTHELPQEYFKTEEFAQIRQLLVEARERHGLVPGGSPTKSGKFLVRLPRTLHAALDREALAEGVSLNQLVVAKLAVGLGRGTEIALGNSSI